MRLSASFALFQAMLNEPSQVFLCGRLYDRIVDDDGALHFAELCDRRDADTDLAHLSHLKPEVG